MKKVFLILILLYNCLLSAQNQVSPNTTVTPPEKVLFTFQKEYPGKVAVWALKYVGDDDDEIRYEGKFRTNENTESLAVYDNLGVLKAFETQIPLSKLPQKAQNYLKKNYPAKAVKEIALVVDDQNKTTYEVGIVKDAKFYDVVFDKNGGFDVIVQKD
ncbi:PepSY domain-containing protein [uncultured Flavobacterium sp.]|uniref:PepSY domain-containing protein n=1 Tax=uncultured Flavobacterium sp. TaxID=165435 RepID=UPI00292E3385|nr:PepSY domain-containing protein [uncultured Flavobacterium sp.]